MRTLTHALVDESRRVFGDPGVLLITAAAVVIYSFFYPIPYAPEVLHDVPVAIIDSDGSGLSRTLARMLDTHEAVRVSVRCASMEEAERLLRAGTVSAVVAVPRGFGGDVVAGRQARIALVADSTYMLAYGQTLRGVLEGTGTLSAGIELARGRAAGRSAESAARARQPVTADLRPLFSPAAGYGTYVVPAVLVLVLQQTLLIGAGLAGGTRQERLARERASGGDPPGPVAVPTLWRAAASVVGRAMPYLALYSANASYCFGFALWYLGFPVMAPAGTIALVTVPFLLSVTMLALALRGIFRRRETAVQVLLFTSLPFVFVAGFAWPVEALPAWIRGASQFVPTSSAIPAFVRILRAGASLADVEREMATLWMLALLYFPFACWAEVYCGRERRPHVSPGA